MIFLPLTDRLRQHGIWAITNCSHIFFNALIVLNGLNVEATKNTFPVFSPGFHLTCFCSSCVRSYANNHSNRKGLECFAKMKNSHLFLYALLSLDIHALKCIYRHGKAPHAAHSHAIIKFSLFGRYENEMVIYQDRVCLSFGYFRSFPMTLPRCDGAFACVRIFHFFPMFSFCWNFSRHSRMFYTNCFFCFVFEWRMRKDEKNSNRSKE